MSIFGKVRQNMKIEGKVATIIFKNDTNNWTVLLVKKKNEYITCVGETEEIEVDDELEFEGEMVSHKVYGEQFKFSSYKKGRSNSKSRRSLLETMAILTPRSFKNCKTSRAFGGAEIKFLTFSL